MEEHVIGLSGWGQATGECWGPVGHAILDAIFGEKPKYKESAQMKESGVQLRHIP